MDQPKKTDIKAGDMASNINSQQSDSTDRVLKDIDMYDSYQSREFVGNVNKSGSLSRIESSQTKDSLETVNKYLSGISLAKTQVLTDFDLEIVSTPLFSHTIDCKTSEDQDRPIVSDILSMTVKGLETLIVTDIDNKCIKSFFMRNQLKHYSRLSMKRFPGTIAKLQDNNIAVTLNSYQIAVVSVAPDLALESTITTQKQYIGLASMSPTALAASSYSPPCVDILDMSGNVIRSISPIHNGQKILRKPSDLCTTRLGNILICDWATKSVLCLTPLGEVVLVYSPTGDRALRRPAGITSTATGHILLVDYHVHKVIVLRETGQFVRDLLSSQEINGISGIDWDEKGRIYVTHLSKSDGINVHVFTLR